MKRPPSILDAIIARRGDRMTPDVAKYFLALDFPASAKARFSRLSDKAQWGTLTDAEKDELDHMVMADAFLTIFQSKARMTLKTRQVA